MGLRVLICGAGIAGATSAALLARGGHQVCVVERDQRVRSSGAPVDVRRGAQDVLADLGVAAQLADHATRVSEAVFVGDTETPIAAMRTTRGRPGELEIPRADLSRIIVTAAQQVADIRFDDTIEALHPGPAGVNVTFRRGKPDRYDLVIGADGIHSLVRRLTFGPEAQFSHYLHVQIATVPVATSGLRPDRVLMLSRPGATVALHPGSGTPLAAFMFRHRTPTDPRNRGDVDQVMQQTFGAVGWRTPELLNSYLEAEDRYFDAVSRIDVPTWTSGRVTLVGDAASCVTLFGEGSSSAILGAHTLARAVQDSGDTVTALARYEHSHRKRIAPLLRGARLASHLLIPATQFGVNTRNALLKASRVHRRHTLH